MLKKCAQLRELREGTVHDHPRVHQCMFQSFDVCAWGYDYQRVLGFTITVTHGFDSLSNLQLLFLMPSVSYNRHIAFIPAFSEPQSHWPRFPPTRLRPIRGRGARDGSCPSGQPPSQSRRTREGLGPIPGSDILPYLYNSHIRGLVCIQYATAHKKLGTKKLKTRTI